MMKYEYLKNVVTLKFDPEKCTNCGMCLRVCPHNVFAIENGKISVVDRDSCMECGACAKNCASSAVYVKAGVGCVLGITLSRIGFKSDEFDCSEQSK